MTFSIRHVTLVQLSQSPFEIERKDKEEYLEELADDDVDNDGLPSST